MSTLSVCPHILYAIVECLTNVETDQRERHFKC